METKTLELNGNKIEIKAYMTGRDSRVFKQFSIDNDIYDMSDPAHPKIKDEAKGKMLDLEDKMIEMGVISVNGDKENIRDKVLDLRSEDYQTVLNEVQGLITGETSKKK